MAASGVYIVMGEANSVVALLNKARRQYQLSHQPPSLEDTEPLLRNFTDLKEVLNEVADLNDMNPLTYLSPFLDVIKAQNTNGPITEAALSAVSKFLSYGLIDASSIRAANTVESIAYAVVHTKFIGGKSSGSDECVLYKILQVLRSLLLSPPGSLLSNEAVCDMMQSCFRIVFEQNLSFLLRKAAETTLADMTQLIFTRLPTFVEDTRHPYMRKLVKNRKSEVKRKRRDKRGSRHLETVSTPEEIETKETLPLLNQGASVNAVLNETEASNLGYDVVLTADSPVSVVTHPDSALEKKKQIDFEPAGDADSESEDASIPVTMSRRSGLQREIENDEDFPNAESSVSPMPYGLPCCRELLRFLIALINPMDRQNTESMVILGLNLLIVALEASADHLPTYSVLLPLIKDNLCRSLLQLLDTEKLPVLAATNRCCFLLFESMRSSMKFQLEAYFRKLQSIVLSDQEPVANEQKEMALESLVHLWRIPGLVTELYLNYDCDLYCANIFEDLTKLLVENAFPSLGGYTASLLSLDALLVVIENIDQNCAFRQIGTPKNADAVIDTESRKLELPVLSGYDLGRRIVSGAIETVVAETDEKPSPLQLRSNRHLPSANLPSLSEVINQKKRKRMIADGTELFNQNPKEGIAFMREKGLLGTDALSVVQWLRTNPHLDKNRIADFICSRKNAEVLEAFVKSFPFANTRLDVALRMFLETFRLPGEAAEISMVMQHFSDEWYRANNEPFNHVDAAFTLSYAVIMLNMDQHNPQVKRNQPPMTVDCFKRNLSGTNGGQDFEPEMLISMYNAIKSDEIVMPAEQVGIIKENYMWKVLLRRGETKEGDFYHAPSGWNDHDLFAVCWGPAVAALSYVFDKSEHEHILQKALSGYRKCASISAHYGMKEVFDNLVIHLCKFSTLTPMREGASDSMEIQRQRGLNERVFHHSSPEGVALAFGENHKAQLATRTLFELLHANGGILREGWRNLLDVLLQMFRARLLPSDLTEVEDFVDEKEWVSILRTHEKELQTVRSETGLLSWFGLGGSGGESDRRKPTQEQLNAIKLSSAVIAECRPSQIVLDSKYLTSTSLAELLGALSTNSMQIVEKSQETTHGKVSMVGEDEDALVFYLELMVSISIENKDRLSVVWGPVRRHLEWLLSSSFGRCPVLVERAVVGLLRVANRNLFRDNTVADEVLQSLSLLLRLSPKALFVFSRQISFGLYKLIRANAANVHRREHWALLFALLESAGAAVLPEEVVQVHERESNARNAFSDGEQERNSNAREFAIDRGYTSDEPSRHSNSLMSEKVLDSPSRSATSLDSINGSSSQRTVAGSTTTTTTAASADWIHLDHRDAARATEEALKALGSAASQRFNPHSLVLRTGLGRHEPAAFLKVCECLAFLLRDAAHVTPDNFESSLQCLRTMVEASFDGGFYAAGPLSGDAQNRLRSTIVEERVRNRTQQQQKTTKKDMTTDVPEDEGRKEEQQLSNSYQQVSLHLLDLCSQLHAKAPAIFARWADSNDGSQAYNSVSFVWSEIGKPLLQAMARLSCDCRRQVRASALAHLQRAFLPSNMTDLGATEWQSCFGEVLFPLLTKLLEPFSAMDLIGMEDTRVRAIQIVAKTLLNHLTALSQLPSFSRLWLRLLDFMEQYLRVDSCGNLNEAVPESLKNMLLVLDNTNTFAAIPGLYEMTVERLQHVFPQLIRDTIPNPPVIATSASSSASGLNALGRVKIAPAAPEEIASVVKPSAQIDIAELTEVIVHSGATSPSTSSPPESSIHTAAGSSQFSHVPQVPVPLAQHTGLQNVKSLPEDHQLYGAHPNFADPPYPIEQSQNFANRTQENFPPTEAYTQSQTFPAYNQMNQSFPSSSFHQTQQNPIGVPLPLVSSPTIHGQYARANPLPFSDYAPQHYDSNTVTASSRSAFSQVPTQPANTPREPPIFSPPNESSYFTPIPYPPPYQQ